MCSPKLTIFWLTYEYDPHVQHDMGGFRATWEKVEALERRGHRIIAFAPRLKKGPGETQAHVVRYPVFALPVIRPTLAYFFQFIAPLRTSRWIHPDLIYVKAGHSPLPLLLGWLLRCPVIIELNGDSAHQAELRGEKIRAMLIRSLLARILPKVERVVAISDDLRLALTERYRLPKDQICLVGSGTNLELFKPLSPSLARQRIGLDPDRPVVGFVGTLFHYQGIQTMIEAAPVILSRFPQVRFLLVGDGEMRQAWEALVQTNGLSNCFHFTGQISYRDVALYINAMDVALAPLIRRRGPSSPLKLFDYWACGRPVVASDLPDLHLVLSESGGAIPVPPENHHALANAVIEILSDEAMRQKLGKSARRFVENHHSWAHIAEQLEQLFFEVVRNGSRR